MLYEEVGNSSEESLHQRISPFVMNPCHKPPLLPSREGVTLMVEKSALSMPPSTFQRHFSSQPCVCSNPCCANKPHCSYLETFSTKQLCRHSGFAGEVKVKPTRFPSLTSQRGSRSISFITSLPLHSLGNSNRPHEANSRNPTAPEARNRLRL